VLDDRPDARDRLENESESPEFGLQQTDLCAVEVSRFPVRRYAAVQQYELC
jgi:hypothetical protein